MTTRLNLRTSAIIVAVIAIVVAVGIAYALQIQRDDIQGSFAVGQVQTAQDTILLYREALPSTADLVALNFGTGDIDAFGFFVTPPTVPFWAANGGGTPFELTLVATNIVLHRPGTGDTPLTGDDLALLLGPAGGELLPAPDHARLINTGDPPVALRAGLKLLKTLGELGLAQGDTITFTSLFKAEAVVEPIVFAELDWPSAHIQNAIVRFIVENGYMVPTDAVSGAPTPLFTDLINGDIHVYMEVWLPNMQDRWDGAIAAGSVIPLGNSLDDAWQIAFVVPTYVISGDASRGISPMAPGLRIPQHITGDVQALFATGDSGGKAVLVNCLAAWQCAAINAAKVTAYALDNNIELRDPGSQAGLFDSLYGAYGRGDPWLGYIWGPTQPTAELDLTVLEEPECGPGQVPPMGAPIPPPR